MINVEMLDKALNKAAETIRDCTEMCPAAWMEGWQTDECEICKDNYAECWRQYFLE